MFSQGRGARAQRCRLYDAPHQFNREMQAEAWEWLGARVDLRVIIKKGGGGGVGLDAELIPPDQLIAVSSQLVSLSRAWSVGSPTPVASNPPSTASTWPLMKLEASPHKKPTALAISSVVP